MNSKDFDKTWWVAGVLLESIGVGAKGVFFVYIKIGQKSICVPYRTTETV